MKSKRLGKKQGLRLNKKTVANLNDDEMKKLRAGGEIASTLPLISCITIGSGGG